MQQLVLEVRFRSSCCVCESQQIVTVLVSRKGRQYCDVKPGMRGQHCRVHGVVQLVAAAAFSPLQ